MKCRNCGQEIYDGSFIMETCRCCLDKEIYNTAIANFTEKLKEKSTFLKSLENDYYGYVSEDEIDEIAEQMKKEV